jgi:hypothetical protein
MQRSKNEGNEGKNEGNEREPKMNTDSQRATVNELVYTQTEIRED